LAIVSRLEAKGVSFCVLSMSGTQFLDTVTGTRRRLMLAMLGAVGQAKREAMLEPQREGIASKPLQGVARQSKLDTRDNQSGAALTSICDL
jgi:DNA invertase Pin-like site-specific DNA recombinase